MSDWPPPGPARKRIVVDWDAVFRHEAAKPPAEQPPHTCRICRQQRTPAYFMYGHPDVCRVCVGDEFRGGKLLSSGAGGGGWKATRGGRWDAYAVNDMTAVCHALVKESTHARR